MPFPAAAPSEFDVIVLGVGGMGSAACLEMARRGARVLGLEQFSLVHDRGSSHGESRIIRKAYFEHPDYVPLLHRAYDLWHELEAATGESLLLPTGLVLSGRPDGDTIRGARLSAEQHHLEVENLSTQQAARRFPFLTFPDDHDVVFERVAGTLKVEACVKAHQDQAVRHRATLRGNEPVLNWASDGTKVEVGTTLGRYTAQKLIITAGAWAGSCLADARIPLTVLRKFVGWFPIQTGEHRAACGMPTYYFELPEGDFYGFPSLDGTTVKVAEHSGDDPVRDPANVDREVHPTDTVRLARFLSNHLPGVGREPVRHSVCLYTVTPDRHFVIDLHPVWKNVAFAAGFSGHGFKFCPVVGEALADLTQFGKTSLPIGFLSANRPTFDNNVG